MPDQGSPRRPKAIAEYVMSQVKEKQYFFPSRRYLAPSLHFRPDFSLLPIQYLSPLSRMLFPLVLKEH